MPGRGLRRGALLLPLSLALCGDSLNMSGGCGRGTKDDGVQVALGCTLEVAGALSVPMDCAGTWLRFSAPGSDWHLALGNPRSASAATPWVALAVRTSGPGQAGITLSTDDQPVTLFGRLDAVTADGLGYGLYDPVAGARGQLTIQFTGAAPLAGTFSATLVPAPVESAPLQIPAYAYPAGRAGTSVTVHGSFREP
jgi:hypothetical protein